MEVRINRGSWSKFPLQFLWLFKPGSKFLQSGFIKHKGVLIKYFGLFSQQTWSMADHLAQNLTSVKGYMITSKNLDVRFWPDLDRLEHNLVPPPPTRLRLLEKPKIFYQCSLTEPGRFGMIPALYVTTISPIIELHIVHLSFYYHY